jgi:phosphatidate cytidylyltransferase
MFKTRLISGIILVLIALATIMTGGVVLLGVLTVVSLIGLTELYQIMDMRRSVLAFVGYAAAILYYIFISQMNGEFMPLFLIILIIVMMAVYVFAFPKYLADQVFLAFFGVFYVAVMLSYIYLTRSLTQGQFIVWLVFFSSWGCDTCAYCVGKLIGKRKMAPILSPKKSVEGGIGGIVGAALLGALYALALNHFAAGAQASPLHYAIICGVGGMISEIGDLAASGIKRNHEVKDYGKLIPGHGGILDRFDSVIFTAPIIYYLAVYLMK